MNKIAIDITGEEWRRVDASPYSVSNMGRVKFSRDGHPDMLRRSISTAKLCTTSVAKLVAMHFCPNPKGYEYIQHINGDSRDNRAVNIAWVRRNTPFRTAAHKNGFGKGGFKANGKFDSFWEDDEYKIPCIRCGRRDDGAPIRRGFCIECWCRILNHLNNGWDGMPPMLSDEALAWASKAPMKELRRMSRIDSGPIRHMDVPRARALAKAREKEKEKEKERREKDEAQE